MKTTVRVDIRTGIVASMVVGASTMAVFGNGPRLPDQDAFATARGEAFAATADNASAIYYNPAGISQLEGWNLRGGFYGIYLPMSYESPAGRTFHNKKTLQGAPQLFGAYAPEGSPLSYGVGLYAPFGLGLHWAQDSGFRTLAIESSLSYLSFNPVVAWQVLPSLSVGSGITINYAKAE